MEEEDAAELDGAEIELFSTDKKNDNGHNGNNGNGGNGNHYGWDKASDSNAGNDENGSSGNNGNDNENSDNNGNANGNTNNTGGSQNQSGILFPEAGEVSELEQEMIDMIKTEGKHKNYELIEYVNDVNREYTEVLMELNINGIMDTAYSYGNERLNTETSPSAHRSTTTSICTMPRATTRTLTCSTCGQDTTAQVRPIS